MASPFKRIAPVDQIDAIFMTDEDVGEQLEAEDPELKAFKERQRASPCYKKVVKSRRDHSAAGRVMNLVEKFKRSGDFVEQKPEENDEDDKILSLEEIREKMKNASPKKKTIQSSITQAPKPVVNVEEKKNVPTAPVKEVEKPVETPVAVPKADVHSKRDAESTEEASDKENTSAVANKKVDSDVKSPSKDSPTKPKPVSSPSKIAASSTSDKKQQTLLSFFKQPTSTSPLKRKREEDNVDDEVQGKSKQLKTHA